MTQGVQAQSLLTTFEQKQLVDLKSGLLLAILPKETESEEGLSKLGLPESEAFRQALSYEYTYSKAAIIDLETAVQIKSGIRPEGITDLDGMPINWSNYSEDQLFIAISIKGAMLPYNDYEFYKNGELKRVDQQPDLQMNMRISELEYDRYRSYIQQILDDQEYTTFDSNSLQWGKKEIADQDLASLYKALKKPKKQGGQVFVNNPKLVYIDRFMYGVQPFNVLLIQRIKPAVKKSRNKEYSYNNRYFLRLNFEIAPEELYKSAFQLMSNLLEDEANRFGN